MRKNINHADALVEKQAVKQVTTQSMSWNVRLQEEKTMFFLGYFA